MRDNFHEQLSSCGRDLSRTAALAADGLRSATLALLEADADRAREAVATHYAIEELHTLFDTRVVEIFACQQPVACDLRLLFAWLRVSADLERMGGLAAHIARIAESRHPRRAVPEEFTPLVTQMAMTGADLAHSVSRLLIEPDTGSAAALAERDDMIDTAHRDLLTALLASGERYDAQTAIDLTLLGRYYERFADHAVAVARGLEIAVPRRTRQRTSP